MINTEIYLAGVRRACQEGLIRVSDSYEPEPGVMPFSNHIDWQVGSTLYPGVMSFTNTRPLYAAIPRILDYYRNSKIRYLELGPGAGNALYDFSRRARQSGIAIHICTASYSPVNPFAPLLLCGDELFAMFSDNPAMEIIEKGPQGCLWRIQTEAVFRFQNETSQSIFGESSEAFIHRQYVGDFCEKGLLESQHFDIIYDMHGPLHRRQIDPLSNAYARLSDQGVLLFVFNAKYPPGQLMLEGAQRGYIPLFKKSDAVIVDPGAHCALVAKQDSPLARRFGEKYPQKPQAVTANRMMDFLRWLDT
jgi:SAM-dependent methyltransferase